MKCIVAAVALLLALPLPSRADDLLPWGEPRRSLRLAGGYHGAFQGRDTPEYVRKYWFSDYVYGVSLAIGWEEPLSSVWTAEVYAAYRSLSNEKYRSVIGHPVTYSDLTQHRRSRAWSTGVNVRAYLNPRIATIYAGAGAGLVHGHGEWEVYFTDPAGREVAVDDLGAEFQLLMGVEYGTGRWLSIGVEAGWREETLNLLSVFEGPFLLLRLGWGI